MKSPHAKSGVLTLFPLLVLTVPLLALTGCAEQTDAGQTASPEATAATQAIGPTNDPNELMDNVVALVEETNALDAQNQELMMKALEMGPEGKDAADAQPLLAEVQAGFDEMTEKQESIAALLGEMAKLDASEELKTYAAQQKEIAEIRIEMYAAWTEIVAWHRKMLPRLRELSESSEADFAKLEQEYYDTYAQLDEPSMRFEKAWTASLEFFKTSGLPKRHFINNMWIPEDALKGMREEGVLPE